MVTLSEDKLAQLEVNGPSGNFVADKISGTYRPLGKFHSRPVYIKTTGEECAYLYYWEDTHQTLPPGYT